MVNTSSKKRPQEDSSSEESEVENEYQVEAIVDKRTRGKKVQYFLKWKGYSEADNTWEDQANMNCPDLIREFEENLKKKSNGRKSNGKNEAKTKRTTKSKKAKVEASDEENQSDDETSTTNGKKVDDDSSTEQNGTRNISIENLDESEEMSRLRLTSKPESNNGDVTQEVNVTNNTTNGEHEKSNSSIEVLNKISPTKETLSMGQTNEPPVNLRLRITPTSTSSPPMTLNDSDNNNNTNEKSSMENGMNVSHEQDQSGTMNDDEEPISKIESVRNDHDGISFRIRLSGQDETQWMSARIANRKYPQAVIAFWESHVEFT